MKNISKELRKKAFLTGYSASIAHLASAFSLVEILYCLYDNINYNPNDLYRDRVILSKGHGSLALYTVLNEKGLISDKELEGFSKPGSILGGEPLYGKIQGIEASTGSLGHGLSIGVGMALAAKLDNSCVNIYVILGDGECQEGTIWEAIMFACNSKLNNLTIIIDNNNIQKMDTIENIMGISSFNERFVSFGLDVKEVNGHDIKELNSLYKLPNTTEKPRVIIAHTIKGKGVKIMENDPRWHFRLPNKKELKDFMEELNITEEEIKNAKNLCI